MTLTKDQIARVVSEYLAARQEIVFAYLFGSVVDSDVFKDVDVGVYVDRRISDGFEYAFNMSGELERLLGYPVDVILLNTAPDHLIHSVSSGTILINRDNEARINFLTTSWSRYMDFEPKRRQWLREVINA